MSIDFFVLKKSFVCVMGLTIFCGKILTFSLNVGDILQKTIVPRNTIMDLNIVMSIYNHNSRLNTLLFCFFVVFGGLGGGGVTYMTI